MANSSPISNPCVICGKQRIIVSQIEEMIGTSKVVSVEMACPDPECQKKLDRQLASEKLKRESAKLNSFNHFGRKPEENIVAKGQQS